MNAIRVRPGLYTNAAELMDLMEDFHLAHYGNEIAETQELRQVRMIGWMR